MFSCKEILHVTKYHIKLCMSFFYAKYFFNNSVVSVYQVFNFSSTLDIVCNPVSFKSVPVFKMSVKKLTILLIATFSEIR